MRRPTRSLRKRWRSTAGCSPTTTPRPPAATITWRNLSAQGKYAAAQPLLEKALEIRRRLLTDDDALTALSFNNLAMSLEAQGRYAAAQPLFEKAWGFAAACSLTTARIPRTATTTWRQPPSPGEVAAAQPLCEKALEIRRRLLSDDHPDTALSYNNVATNLLQQGKYAAAQPFYEKALEIHRRLLTDNHPATATSTITWR